MKDVHLMVTVRVHHDTEPADALAGVQAVLENASGDLRRQDVPDSLKRWHTDVWELERVELAIPVPDAWRRNG